MKDASRRWQSGLLALAALAVGVWLGGSRPVAASGLGGGDDVLQFQLAGVNQRSSLLVYEPSKRTVYVYQGALTGNAELGCSFKFVLGRPGENIRRMNCPVPTMH